MTLALFTDANEWLPVDKVKFVNADDAAPEANNADNLIRATLYGTYPTLVTTWDADPTAPQVATPVVVREAASMLMASFRYQKKFSEQSTRTAAYAQWLYDTAMGVLNSLVSGDLQLYDVVPLPGGVTFSSADFWPNNTTGAIEEFDAQRHVVAYPGDSDIKFRMAKEF